MEGNFSEAFFDLKSRLEKARGFACYVVGVKDIVSARAHIAMLSTHLERPVKVIEIPAQLDEPVHDFIISRARETSRDAVLVLVPLDTFGPLKPEQGSAVYNSLKVVAEKRGAYIALSRPLVFLGREILLIPVVMFDRKLNEMVQMNYLFPPYPEDIREVVSVDSLPDPEVAEQWQNLAEEARKAFARKKDPESALTRASLDFFISQMLLARHKFGKAVATLEKSLAVFEALGRKEEATEASKWLVLALSLQKKVDKAIEAAEKLAEKAKAENDQELLFESLLLAAIVKMHADDLDGSRKYLLKALEIKEEFPFYVSSALFKLGYLAFSKEDYAEALQWYRQAAEHARKFFLPDDQIQALMYQADILTDLDRDDEAIEVLEEAVSVAREMRKDEDLAVMASKLAFLLSIRRELDRARDYATEALNAARRAGHTVYEALSLLALGDIAMKRGETARSYAFLSQAREISARTQALGLESEALLAMSNIKLRENEPDKALEYAKEAAKKARKAKSQTSYWRSLLTQAFIHLTADRPGKAREIMERAVRIVEKDENLRKSLSEGTINAAYSYLLQSYLHLGRYEEALKLAPKVLDYYRTEGKPEDTARLLLNIADAYKNLRRFEEAFEYLDEAYAFAERVGDLPLKAKILINKAWAFLDKEEKDAAFQTREQLRELEATLREEAENGDEDALDSLKDLRVLDFVLERQPSEKQPQDTEAEDGAD